MGLMTEARQPQEREKRYLSPLLMTYLGSQETRRQFRDFHRFEILEQDDEARYYSFRAERRDPRREQDSIRKGDHIEADVVLGMRGTPLFLRTQLYQRFWDTKEINITAFHDLNTVVQGKVLREVNNQKAFLLSVRTHVRKGDGGMHVVYDTDGPLKKIEIYPRRGVRYQFNYYDSEDEGSGVDIVEPELEDIQNEYESGFEINEDGLRARISVSEGISFEVRSDVAVVPELCWASMETQSRGWVNIFQTLPARLSVSMSHSSG